MLAQHEPPPALCTSSPGSQDIASDPDSRAGYCQGRIDT
jgi:hypothetical protein